MKGKVMVYQNADTEKFIKLIQQHPLLYDPNNNDYKNGPEVNKTWNDIKIYMALDGFTVSDWKRRWRNLRDNYVRLRRLAFNGNYKVIKWRFMKDLRFLENYVEAPSYYTDPYADNKHFVAVKQENEDAFQMSEASDEFSSISTSSRREPNPNLVTPSASSSCHSVSAESESRLSLRHEVDDLDYMAQEFVNDNKKNFEESTHRDEIDSFFESCCLRVKKMNPSTRSLILLQMSQILFNAENPHLLQPILLVPTPNVPPPSCS